MLFFLWRYRRTKSGSKWGWFTRSTTTVYDPLMFVLSEFLDQKECLLSVVKAIREDLKPFYQKNYDVFEGRNSNRSDIEKRITLYREFFKSILRINNAKYIRAEQVEIGFIEEICG